MWKNAAVFISYSIDDHSIANQLALELGEHGIRYWIDSRTIQPGTEWERPRIDAIANCHAFILIATPNSREDADVRAELELAQKAYQASVELHDHPTSTSVFYRPVEPILKLAFLYEGEAWPEMQAMRIIDVRDVFPGKHLFEEMKTFCVTRENSLYLN